MDDYFIPIFVNRKFKNPVLMPVFVDNPFFPSHQNASENFSSID